MPALHDKTKQPELKAALDELVLGWPHVTSGMMFGSRSYRVKDVLFAMIGGRGLILTKLNEEQRSAATVEHDAHPFAGRGKTVPAWTEFTLAGADGLAPLAPLVRGAYQNALAEAKNSGNS